MGCAEWWLASGEGESNCCHDLIAFTLTPLYQLSYVQQRLANTCSVFKLSVSSKCRTTIELDLGLEPRSDLTLNQLHSGMRMKKDKGCDLGSGYQEPPGHGGRMD